MLDESDHVVVIGAGLAGWRLVESLRRHGYAGSLTLVGQEPYAPYDRPPLSKQILAGKWDSHHSTLATPELVASHDVTLRLGLGATALDVATTTVQLQDGSTVEGTFVVVATGSRARRLPFSADAELYTVRDRDDVIRLLSDLERLATGDVVAVIGGGFVGAEVATQLKVRGLRPVVLEAGRRPLHGVVGDEASQWLAPLASWQEIELRNEVTITDVIRDGDGFSVEFANAEPLHARVVVVAAGALPNVEWLATSGLDIDNGVVVDRTMVASERVAAIGDVARFEWHAATGQEFVRIEHWELANVHAQRLGLYLATGEVSPTPIVPYFWSDQYGKKIQMLGHPRASDDVVMVSGDADEGKWLCVYARDGLVSGVLALSNPRALMLSKTVVEQTTTLAHALERAPWVG